MRRIHALAYATQMIEVEAGRDRAAKVLVSKPMGDNEASGAPQKTVPAR